MARGRTAAADEVLSELQQRLSEASDRSGRSPAEPGSSIGATWRDVGDGVGRTVGSVWVGDAADAYGNHASRVGGDVAVAGQAAASVASTLETMADELDLAQRSLDDRLAEMKEKLTQHTATMHPANPLDRLQMLDFVVVRQTYLVPRRRKPGVFVTP